MSNNAKQADVFWTPQIECPDCGTIWEIDETQPDIEFTCYNEDCKCLILPVDNR